MSSIALRSLSQDVLSRALSTCLISLSIRLICSLDLSHGSHEFATGRSLLQFVHCMCVNMHVNDYKVGSPGNEGLTVCFSTNSNAWSTSASTSSASSADWASSIAALVAGWSGTNSEQQS